MKLIPLTRGYFAKVDDEDFEWLRKFHWTAKPQRGGQVYAVTSVRVGDDWITIAMHTLITGFDVTDHIDGDGRNNQRSNLRESTYKRNSLNKTSRKGSSSRFKGVTWDRGVWRVTFAWHPEIDRAVPTASQIRLGPFESEEEAARVRDHAVRVRTGPDDTHNFPRPGERSAVTGEVTPGDPTALTWGLDYLAENPDITWGDPALRLPPEPVPDGMKRCSNRRCGVKPVSEFGPNVAARDGLQGLCRPCSRAAGRKSYRKRRGPLKGRRLPPAAVRLCNHCGVVGEFGFDKRRNRLNYWCKDCCTRATRESRERKAAAE